MKTYCIKVSNDLNYGFVVKWLRHHSFKVGLMGSIPFEVIMVYFNGKTLDCDSMVEGSIPSIHLLESKSIWYRACLLNSAYRKVFSSILMLSVWDCSSNGRITALQAEGCGFKSHQFHFGCVAKRYGNWLLTSISKVQVLSHPLLLL